jgi:hypothetical protein
MSATPAQLAEADQIAAHFPLHQYGYAIEAVDAVVRNDQLTDADKIAVLKLVLELRNQAVEDE